MATTVITDLIDGNSARVTLANGYEFDRIAVVEGLTVAEGEGHSKIYNALNDAGMPKVGDPHPAVAYAILREIQPVEEWHNGVKFRLHYAQRDPSSSSGFADDSIQSGASVVQESKNKDINGDEIALYFTYPVGYKTTPDIEGNGLGTEYHDSTGALVTVMIPLATRVIQKQLNYDPDNLADTYVGKINSGTWKGKAAKTMLCTAIRGFSDDGGSTFKTNFEFQYKPNTWVNEAVFIKSNGKPPAVTDVNSERSVDLGNPIESYETIAFSGLPV